MANAYPDATRQESVFSDRRGVSETVGFVLIFSLVLLTVGVVFTVGYSGLQDARDAERINNAERAFDVLANNVEDITNRGAPSRGTEIRLAEASLGSGGATSLNITGVNDSGGREFSTGNYSLDPVVYGADDTTIRYAGGVVSRLQPQGAVLLREPSYVLSDRRAIIPVVQLSVEDRSIAGSRTVLVRSERRLRDVIVDSTDTEHLFLNLSTPAADTWERYLEAEGMACTRPNGEDGQRLTCERDGLDRVQIVHFEIRVTFE